MNAEPACLVYCPCPDLDTARRLGHGLLNARLAGCINILPGMVSLYEWEGKREESQEAVLIAKTSAAKARAVRHVLEKEHPYAVPAILVLPLAEMNPAYRDWLFGQISEPA